MRYQGVEIKSVPIMNVTSGTPDTSSILLDASVESVCGLSPSDSHGNLA